MLPRSVVIIVQNSRKTVDPENVTVTLNLVDDLLVVTRAVPSQHWYGRESQTRRVNDLVISIIEQRML